MKELLLGLVYLMFFASGAAALIYQVVWVRSLSLVFGGTHLAVTTVLSVFMGGLALGSYLIGRRVDGVKKPLGLYGYLELGIALSALGFLALMQVYPSIYIFLVGGGEHSRLYLTIIRVLFTSCALIVPTTLMGGTLPVLTRFVASHPDKLGTRLSVLYALNTLGAVCGTAGAAFFLLRFYSVSFAMATAIGINIAIGLAGILLRDRVSATPKALTPRPARHRTRTAAAASQESAGTIDAFSPRLVLLGIGVSGFCALGYEVLWTRVLTLTIGTSVYGFSTMLIAFLTGIALGSESFGLFRRLVQSGRNETRNMVLGFGMVQCVIGVCALVVTFYIRDLPSHSVRFVGFFERLGLGVFESRQWGNLTLAFSYMVFPAYFMGLAFPIAGTVNASRRTRLGHAVGHVLTSNTVGAILGSAVSGYSLIFLFGIERSLQLLTVVNFGIGLLVIASLARSRLADAGVIAGMLAALAVLASRPDAFRMWNARYFAIFQNNRPEAYETPEKIRDAIDNTDVLFYNEGIDSTISSIKVKGGNQAVLVNGKVVASDALRDRQCQYTLGHLPMLLHKDPGKVLVVGLGTGMTLGATSVHPGVEELTLVEIEPNVIGAARTFGKFNHYVLDDPKLKIVFNDGRNFLMTTRNKYDVITADPIHPWTRGSGYLYTAEYFKLASEHLLPGGVMCQWLPIYELSVEDLRSVVRTFSSAFRYSMLWMTQYDAEIIGSSEPIQIDEETLDERISFPAVAQDLRQVMMGTANDFLSYFVMGTKGMAAFGKGGVRNTDDNLFLEYSTPLSVGRNLTGVNVGAIVQYREGILPYLVPTADPETRTEQEERWARNEKAAATADRAHALLLDGKMQSQEFLSLLDALEKQYPDFLPGKFVHTEHKELLSRIPRLIEKTSLRLLRSTGEWTRVEISAVLARIGQERAAVVFVDNARREMFGQRYFSGENIDERTAAFSREVLADIQKVYQAQARIAATSGRSLPASEATMARVKEVILKRCGG